MSDSPAASRWARLSHIVFFAVLVFVTAFQAPISDPAPDAFHEGEYAMYGVQGGHIPSGRALVLTHGGIDLIPARIVSTLCPTDGQIVCVRGVNATFTFICEAVFLTVLVFITGLGTLRAIVAGFPAMTTLIAYNGSARSAFALQTGSPNLRELFILLMLGCLFLLFRDEQRMTSRTRYLLVAATGFLSGLGIFWIFNRGEFGTLLLAGTTVGLAWLWRDWRPLPIAAAGWFAGVGLGGITGIYGGLASNFENMWYFQWDTTVYAMPFDVVAAAGPAIPVYAVLIGWAVVRIWLDLRADEHRSALPLLTLVGVLLFYGYQVHERPFAGYVAHVLWGLSLLFAVLFFRTTRQPAGGSRLAALTVVSVAVSIGCAMLNARYMPPNPIQVARNLARNARAVFVKAPRDTDLVADGLRQAAAIIRARSPACTYAFSNEGLLYVLSNTPPCSRYAYPFYVGPDRQADAIADFEQSDPPIVLWASSTWSDAIFNRGLESRTPALAAWASAHFPYRLTLPGGYQLRAREPFGPAPTRVAR